MILISLGFCCPRPSSEAHPMLHPLQNRTASHSGLFLEPTAGFFTTSENFDSNSARSPLPGSNSNLRILTDLFGSYGISDDFFLFGRLTTQTVNVSILSQPGISSFGLGDQLLGAAYRWIHFDSGGSINLQAEATLPAYSNSSSKTSGLPYMGDGSTDLTGSAFVEISLSDAQGLYLEGGGGFTWRSNGFSAAVPYSFFLKKDPPAQGLLFEIGITGQASLKTDIASTDSGLRTTLDQDRLSGAGGSNLLNALNPSWMSASGRIGYKNKKGNRFHLSVLFPFQGTLAAAGLGGTLGASFDFGAKPENPPPEETPRTLRIAKGFQSYDLEAEVVSFNDQLYLARINQGAGAGIKIGQIFDIYDQENRVAQARVQQTKNDESILTVVEYYKETWIQKGFLARRRVQ